MSPLFGTSDVAMRWVRSVVDLVFGLTQGASTLMDFPVLLFLPPTAFSSGKQRKWRCSRIANSPNAKQRAQAVRIFYIFNDVIRKLNAY